jgi:AMME syndrome candidate gene 1 protein
VRLLACALVYCEQSLTLLRWLSISLLTDFEDASSYLDWTLGVHGIYISFPYPSALPALSSTPSSSSTPSPLSSSTSLPSTRSRFSKPTRQLTATYLPDVAVDQGWTKVEAVDSAIHKAGWDGRINEDVRRSVTLRRYQSRMCVVGWDEYHAWRTAQGGEL